VLLTAELYHMLSQGSNPGRLCRDVFSRKRELTGRQGCATITGFVLPPGRQAADDVGMEERSEVIRCRGILVWAMLCLVMACLCAADTIWDYEAVNGGGLGSHPLVDAAPAVGNRVTIEGVALAAMNDLWNADNPISGQYALFVQDDKNTRGGMEIWAGCYWYDDWRPAQYASFSAGDRVRINGLLGNHSGKVFINDRHTDDPNVIFSVEVIDHPGMPDPELIPAVANCNYFDQTRADGGERYQTRWTMLHGVQITGGTWANNSTLTIADSSGSVALYLPPAANVAMNPQPTGKLSLVGIFDQEDAGSGTPTVYHGNYRLIIKNYNDIATALDVCREVRQRDDGDRVALINKVVSRTYGGYFYLQDVDRTGGVRVVSSRIVAPGDVLSVQGLVSTVDGEKAITPDYIALSGNAPKPVYVNSAALHGQTGLDVFGLLVRTVGVVGASVGGGIYEFADDAGRTILLDSNGTAIPAQGTRVSVTAVASGNSTTPRLLLSNAHDIAPVQ
jgi:hypothetical protein